MAVEYRHSKSFERRAVESELKYWGYWYGRIVAADDFPPEEAVSRLKSGRSTRGGHKVLIPDMPSKAWRIHVVICGFEEDLREVLIARYCLPPKHDYDRRGRLVNVGRYEASELAEIVGVTLDQYRRRLTRAKRAYQREVFGY